MMMLSRALASRLGPHAIVRARGLFGVLFVVLGATIIVRTTMLGHPGSLWTSWVLGGAMMALGVIRVRTALATWSKPAP